MTITARIEPPQQRQREAALAALVGRKDEIDTMLARLQALSADHFGWLPEEITWSHVGSLDHHLDLLRRILEMAQGSTDGRSGVGRPND